MSRGYFIQTFGCQMNAHDSRRMEEVLTGAGYVETSSEDANLIVFNTCSIREKAEQKLMSVLGSLRARKEANPDLVIAVAGCVAQQEGDTLLRKAPFLDLVIGPDNIPELPTLVEHILDGGAPTAQTKFDTLDPKFLYANPDTRSEVSSYVTVMKGCDERCTYCIVPTTRGPERYRPMSDILGEIKILVQGGVKEITLLGQTVNSWYEVKPFSNKEPSHFSELLRAIGAEVPDLLRLRYTSPHPRHVTPELIRAHAELPQLVNHVHLPVQSGSDVVLRRMLRRYTAVDYIDRALALKAARNITVSSDIIVGFPGETEDDFQQTLNLVEAVGFVSVFGFKYSPRPGVPALRFEDDVPEEVKSERLTRLFTLTEGLTRKHLNALVGTSQEVLFEHAVERKGDADTTVRRWKGRTFRNEVVHVDVDSAFDLTGVCAPIAITSANPHSLHGAAPEIELPRALPSTKVLAKPAKIAIGKRLPTINSPAS